MDKAISIRPGETYSFDLETHVGGGYLWRVATNDEKVARVQILPHKATNSLNEQPLGKSLPVAVEIRALAVGETTILLEERREWEKDSEPLNVCRVELRIEN